MLSDETKSLIYWIIGGGHFAFTIAYLAWHLWHGRPS